MLRDIVRDNSVKPLCTKTYVATNGRGSLCKTFLSTVCSVALPFHHRPGALRNFLTTPPFFSRFGAQAVGASASHEIKHMGKRCSALSPGLSLGVWTRDLDGGAGSQGRGGGGGDCTMMVQQLTLLSLLIIAGCCKAMVQ